MPSILDYSRAPDNPVLRPDQIAVPDESLSFSERLAKLGGPLEIAATVANPVGTLAGTLAKDIVEHPGEFSSLFSAAERQTRLVDNAFATSRAREEAYDRRIKAVKGATGIDLPNPERGGYQLTERELRELNRDGPIDPAAYRRQRFEQDLAAARVDHPDNREMVFGDIDKEAEAIAAGAEADYAAARKETPLSTPASLVAELGGGLWAQRRDPVAMGSLLAGPTSAVGKTVAARILSSGLFQGLYNAGLAALEQPSVQAWRQQIGVRSGVVPAAENVGFAFLAGLIPGAIFRGGHEALSAGERTAVKRIMDGGLPEKGDIEKLKGLLNELQPPEHAAIKLGEDMDAAARATAPARAKDVPPELHDDLEAAAARYGENPIEQPSPAGVAAIDQLKPETIAAAALRDADGKIHVGPTHGDALINLEDAGAKTSLAPADEGFVTSTGRFVSREEAKAIAQGEGQVSPFYPSEYLHSATVKKPGSYGSMAEEIEKRVAAAAPQTEREAQLAASEALEDIGNRQTIARTTEQLDSERLPPLKLDVEKVINFPASPDGKTPASTATRYRITGGGGADRGVLDISEQGKNLEVVWVGGEHGEKVDLGAASVRGLFRELKEIYPNAETISGARISGAHRKPGQEAAEVKIPLSPPASSKDPLDRIPLARDDGTSTVVSARQAARAGERETQLADLIRECK